MPHIQTITLTPTAASANAISLSQKPTGGGANALLLNGAQAGGPYEMARIIAIASDGDDSGHTFAIVGTNSNGEAQSETIAVGPNGATVVSTKFYSKITSITISAAATGNLTVGTVGTTLSGISNVYPLNYRAYRAPLYIAHVSGTLNYTIKESFDELGSGIANLTQIPLSAHTAKTADTNAAGTFGARSMEVVLNSYSTGAILTVYVTQANDFDCE